MEDLGQQRSASDTKQGQLESLQNNVSEDVPSEFAKIRNSKDWVKVLRCFMGEDQGLVIWWIALLRKKEKSCCDRENCREIHYQILLDSLPSPQIPVNTHTHTRIHPCSTITINADNLIYYLYYMLNFQYKPCSPDEVLSIHNMGFFYSISQHL